MTQVGEIARIVSEIAVGAKEQSAGLDEVNIAINQMDEVTQQQRRDGRRIDGGEPRHVGRDRATRRADRPVPGWGGERDISAA